MKLRFGSFCSGIGAPEVAWSALGMEPAFFSEIEPFPCAVLAHHFPGVPNFGDMNRVHAMLFHGGKRIRRGRASFGLIEQHQEMLRLLTLPEIFVAGSPCQSFSVAGLRGSMSDDRGNLALTFCRIIHVVNPKFAVYENVPGILSTKDNAFGCLLAGLVGSSDALKSGLDAGRWPDAGMVIGPVRSAAWRVLDAQGIVPQRRRRVFVVSCRVSDGINPGAVLFEPEASLVECLGNWDRTGSLFSVEQSLCGHPAPSREAGARIAAGLTRGADSSGKGGYAGRRREDDFNIVTNALDAHMGMGGPDDNAAQANHLIADFPQTFGGNNTKGPIEVATAVNACKSASGRLDFESETFIVGAINANGKAAGSATQQDAECGMLVTHSLRAEGFDASEDGTGRGTPLVPMAYQCHGSNVGPMGTVRSGNGNETGGVPFVAQPIPLLEIGKGTASRGQGPNGCGIADEGDPMFTLQSGDPCHTLAKGANPSIAFQERGRADGPNVETQDDLAYSLTAPNGGGRRQEMNVATPTMAVRRLTVIECSRLQNFPDTFLHIPMRARKIGAEEAEYLTGHGVDCWLEDGEWKTRCPADGPMYRALGNSMCVGVVRWIGQRIIDLESL
jgi:DNA (cytosine-5)-methyltransferase 1